MQDAVILKEEFNQDLKTMKTRKTSDVKDITSELIQNANPKIQDELFKLVNNIYITGEITKDLKII